MCRLDLGVVLSAVLSLVSSACGDGIYVLGALADDSDDAAWSDDQGVDDGSENADPPGDNSSEPVGAPSTLVFAVAEALDDANGPIEHDTRVAPTVADWDGDGDVDLLLALSSGEVVLHDNTASGPGMRLAPGIVLRDPAGVAVGGAGLTAATTVDDDGDGRLDLLLSVGSQLLLYRQVADLSQPSGSALASAVVVAVDWPAQAEGRLAAVDWNDDGAWDLLTATDDTSTRLYANTGLPGMPTFDSFTEIDALEGSYGDYVTVLDYNADGHHDVLLGHPDGRYSLRVSEGGANPVFESRVSLRQWAGPWFEAGVGVGAIVDVDGDGLGDLVLGGDDGRVTMARGIDYSVWLTRIRDLVEFSADSLGQTLADDSVTRDQLFGLHKAVREGLDGRFFAADQSKRIYERYIDLAQTHAALFCRSTWDVATDPYLPLLATQHVIILHAARPDSPQHRQDVIEATCLQGERARLFTDFAVLLADNGQASAAQHAAIHGYLSAIPRHLWDVALLYVSDWLGPTDGLANASSRASVWLNSIEVGAPENSFPADSEAAYADVFTITLAHLLNHHSLDRVGRRKHPDMYRRKFALLAQAGGDDVVHHEDIRRGVDWDATRERFLARGLWDADGGEDWEDAWTRYFDFGDGQDLYYHALRSNVDLLLERPRYAFATLANQYFTDSQIMLDLAKARWDRGYYTNINQFLHFVEYYADATDEVAFYRMSADGLMATTNVALERDALGRVERIVSSVGTYDFIRDDAGDVVEFAFLP